MQTVTIRKQDLVLGNVCGMVKSLSTGNGTVNNLDMISRIVVDLKEAFLSLVETAAEMA
jgi:hypothetical protein